MKGQSTILLRALASRLGRWTRPELLEATGLSKKNLGDAIYNLIQKGHAQRLVGGDLKATKRGLKTLSDFGELAAGPRAPYELERCASSFTSRLWKAFRMKRRATAYELVTLAARPTDKDALRTASRYLMAYVQAGFAVCQPNAAPGPSKYSHGRHVYILINDPGTKAPQYHLQKKRLFDPNSGATHELA